jgi:hypothetical protein
MTEAFTIGHEELAILSDFVGGWDGKWAANNLQTDKRQALQRLIANGFLEPAVDAAQNINTRPTPSYFSPMRRKVARAGKQVQ